VSTTNAVAASAVTASPVWAASQSAATAAQAKAAAQAKVQAAAAAKAKAEAAAKDAAQAKAVAASRTAERAKLAAAKAAAAAKAYVTPVAHPTISENFGVPGPWAAGYHTGTDFAVNVGTAVHAVTSGTVVSAGWQNAYGNTVVVHLSDGRYALYAHLSHIGVQAGQHVAKGAQLGKSGNTGNSTGPHLHFEIRTSNAYGAVVNPVTYLKQHGASL
jgi:murein DD-endopeptidase MepM/ murein hydrolase activator NlpD